tara:strand:- start:4194 stop:5216 length:1023 start_codon:yes stop_codon:yes gene_type:complete
MQHNNQYTQKNKWSCLEELMSLLPEVNVFSYKGSIDRFGFSYILAKICGFEKPRRTFAEWVHGWHWHDLPTSEILGLHLLNRSVPVVVANKKEYEALKNEDFSKVIIGGLPAAYVKQQHSYRNENALLSIPPHTGEHIKFENSQTSYLDYLESIKRNFDGIYVCIFYLDWDGPLHKGAKERGLHVIQGARPDDANSLIRMRSIFDAFNYVTSNFIGSHFVYAQFSNCKFSLSGPKYHDNEQVWLQQNNKKKYSLSEIQKMVEIRSEQYLKENFNSYLLDDPRKGICDMSTAISEIGFYDTLNKNEILDAVGWSFNSKIRGYIRGGLNKTKGLIKNKKIVY